MLGKSAPAASSDRSTDEDVLLLCMKILRWLGLTFTQIRWSPGGGFVATDSKLRLLANAIVPCVFLLASFQVNTVAFGRMTNTQKATALVYPLYTKLMAFAIVVFSLCGNVYNRKFVGIVNLFLRVKRQLERDFGRFGRRRVASGYRIILCFFGCAGVSTALNLWTDAHLVLYNTWSYRLIHYSCFYCVTLFTAHFVTTMNYMEERFRDVNALFGKIVSRGNQRVSDTRRRLSVWMAAFADLREAEELVNEVFGKQLFITFLLAFSGVVVNAFYLVTLNLYGKSYSWMNATMWLGFIQSVTVAVLSTMAAESALYEANRINQIIFRFPVHLHDWQMFNKVKYFALFTHHYRLEFKVWIFYSIDYDSLLKVILVSSAITAIIIQCDFLMMSSRDQHRGDPDGLRIGGQTTTPVVLDYLGLSL